MQSNEKWKDAQIGINEKFEKLYYGTKDNYMDYDEYIENYEMEDYWYDDLSQMSEEEFENIKDLYEYTVEHN